MTQTLMIVGWAIAFVFFIVCEIATATALVSIWLGFGALVSMFFANRRMHFTVQLVVFDGCLVLLLIFTRPLVKKVQGKTVHTNYELDIGKTAVVTEDINNALSSGRVKLSE